MVAAGVSVRVWLCLQRSTHFSCFRSFLAFLLVLAFSLLVILNMHTHAHACTSRVCGMIFLAVPQDD